MPVVKEMKPTYKVFILDEDEFNSLHRNYPVTEKDLKEGLGFAYQKTRECFVKRTGIKELDDETILHEAQELLAKNSDDEDENNIRWKKGGAARSIVPIVLGALAAPFTGGSSLIPILLGAASSIGMNQYAQSQHPEELGKPGTIGGILTQGATGALSGLGGAGVSGAIAGGIKGATAAAPGILSKAGGAITGVGQGLISGAGEFAPAKPGIVSGTNSLVNTFNASQAANPLLGTPVTLGGLTSNISNVGGSLAAAPIATILNALPTITNLLGSSTPSTVATTPGIAPTQSPLTNAFNASQNAALPSLTPTVSGVNAGAGAGIEANAAKPTLMESLKSAVINPTSILGAGSLLASQAPKTPAFQMPSYVADLQSKLMQVNAISPLGQQARDELSTILKSTPQELMPTANDAYYEAALRRTRTAYDEAQKNLDASYNVAGVYGGGEHLAAKAKLEQQYTNAQSDLYAQTEQRRFELARTEKYNAIQQALGVDAAQMDDIAGLTGLDVQTAAMMYGAQVKDVQSIRENLGTLGVELLLRGSGVNRQPNVNITLGR